MGAMGFFFQLSFVSLSSRCSFGRVPFLHGMEVGPLGVECPDSQRRRFCQGFETRLHGDVCFQIVISSMAEIHVAFFGLEMKYVIQCNSPMQMMVDVCLEQVGCL